MSVETASLKNVPIHDKEKIVALPMRVGLWMSIQGTEDAVVPDELESLFLVERLEAVTRQTRSVFVKDVFLQTLALRSRWLNWTKDLSSVPNECQAVSVMLKQFVSERDYQQYKQAVFSIAESLATPPDRQDNGSFTLSDRIADWFREALIRMGVNEDHFSPVMPERRPALNAMARALQIRIGGMYR